MNPAAGKCPTLTPAIRPRRMERGEIDANAAAQRRVLDRKKEARTPEVIQFVDIGICVVLGLRETGKEGRTREVIQFVDMVICSVLGLGWRVHFRE